MSLKPPVDPTGVLTYSSMDEKIDRISIDVRDDEYGAVGDGVTNDTTALQAAIADLPAEGGTLLLTGTFLFSSTLSFDDKRSVIIKGVGGVSAGATTRSQLLYTGTGTAISAKSTFGFTIQDVWVRFNNDSHLGTLIDLGQSALALDTSYARFERCLIGSGTSTIDGTGILVSLDKAICCTFSDVTFGGGNIGVRGQATGASYSNVIRFYGCTFLDMATIAAKNADDAWLFSGCNFQQLISGNAGAYLEDAVAPSRGVTFHACGFYDANTSGTWIAVADNGRGLNVEGCYMGAGSVGVSIGAAFDGINITGNVFDTITTAISLSSSCTGYHAKANSFPSVTTKRSGTGGFVSVASASTITLPNEDGAFFVITGTTTINIITGSWAGRIITLYFGDVVTVTEVSNLALGGAFTSTANDTLTLVTDGVNWYEVARSIN